MMWGVFQILMTVGYLVFACSLGIVRQNRTILVTAMNSKAMMMSSAT